MPKTIFFLHGPMGSGKTTTSKLLHEKMISCARVALPDIRRIVSGENHNKGDLAREVMLEMTKVYCQHDVPVVVEIVCKPAELEKYMKLATEYGYTFLPFLLTADEEVRWQRVCMRTAGMMEVDTLPASKEEELKRYFDENNTFYNSLAGEMGEIIDTNNLTPEQVVSYIKDKIS